MSETNLSSRNSCLDFVKGIACICVVFMHCEFPGTAGVVIQAVSRFCVPFFFMVSGYFCFSPVKTVNYTKKIKHIGIITLAAFCFYTVLAVLFGTGLKVTAGGIMNWIAFNSPVIIVGQMWFLFALLYDYIVFAAADRSGLTKAALFAIPVLIAVYIILAQGMHLAGKTVANMYYRNWLIEGFPFFAGGYWIHRKQDKIKIPDPVLIGGAVLFTALCLVERKLMGRDFGVNIVTFPQVFCLFMLCVKNPGFGAKSIITKLGKGYSLYVYIFHPAIWNFLRKVYSALHISHNTAALYLLPVLVAAASIIWSVIYSALWKRVKSLCLNKLKGNRQ